MGIPSYFSYIVKNHPEILKQLHLIDIIVNNFYLDCNSIIYDAIHNIDFTTITEPDTDVIINKVILKIDEYINVIKPISNLFIAFDGVAPVAKLNQQRERRYKSLYQTKITRSIYKNTKPDAWNTAAITPGTIFMKKLNEKIKNYYNDPKKYNISNIIISTSNNYGEGEHKIFDFIRRYPEYHSKDTNTIIYGLDADLIMLGINHLPICKNIYLFRETPHFIQSISSELEPNKEYILDLPELAKNITINMNNEKELSEEQKINRVHDYIFMCFFLGNDFMPHFPAVNIRTGGVDKMLNAYKNVIGNDNENLTDGKKIYWKNVRKLVKFLADNEEEFIKNEIKLRDRISKRLLPDETPDDKYKKFDSIPIYERSLEKHINPFNNNWKERYYKTLFHIDPDKKRIEQICTNYLEGLEWTMKYYTSGCADWRWCYNYDYPPLLCDLIHFIPYFDTEFIIDKNPMPVTELVQLCYVLPKESLQLLPNDLYDKLLKKHGDWYDNDCEFIWAFCKYFWESHVRLPHIDINELEQFIQEYTTTIKKNIF
jgi:5'-3' exonuclease